MSKWHKLEPLLLSVLRVIAGFLFWQHGLQKIFGWFGGQIVPTFSLLWFAGLLETVTGPLIVIGLLTRPVAFVLAGEMLVTYLIGHMPQGPWPLTNGGVVPLLFGFIFLHLAAAGPGKIAADSFFSGSPSFHNLLRKFAPLTLTVLRIGAAFLFWQFGASKFLGLFGGRPPGFPQLRWFAGVIEFFGGPMMALGLFTRPLAFLLAGEMAIAFWTSHVPRGLGFWPIQNAGEPAVLFCFLYLYVAAAGPGRLSLDGLFFRKSATRS